MESNVKLIAHRGYSHLYPENTLAAFKAAMEYDGGSDTIFGIELDVQLTADDRIVVFHDANLKQLCGREEEMVRETSYDKLLTLAETSELLGGEKIPLLDEVLTFVNHAKVLFIEIKSQPNDQETMGPVLAELLESYKPDDDVVLHAFSQTILEDMIERTRHLKVKYGFLFNKIEELQSVPAEFFKKIDYLHPQYDLLFTHEDQILDHGLALNNVWTVNSPQVVERLMSLKSFSFIEAIATNNLALTVS